jgi:hypothetical protein
MELSQGKSGKPKWLRKLERESWQPELIISGAAIIGSLQLPGLIERAQVYGLLEFDRDTLFIFYITVIYWKLFASSLIISFIFHFVIRALWIGLVGLNSVYPGGFTPNKRFSEHFQEKLREEFGDVDGLINRLDQLASGVFGISFGIAGVFLNFGIIGVVLVLLHAWLISLGLSPQTILYIFGGLLVPLFLLSLASMILNLERLRETSFARRFHYPIASAVSRTSYLLGRRFISTSLNIVTSYYADRKSFGWGFILFMFLMFLVGVSYSLSDSNIRFLIDDVYHRMGNDSTRVHSGDREGGGYEGLYFRPQISTPEATTRGSMTVWVPLPEREIAVLEAGCSRPEVSDTLPREERRHLNRERFLDCSREYITLAINDRPITDYTLHRENRVNTAGAQFGVRALILDPPLRRGDNLLSVTTRYPHSETGEPRQAYVPFTFVDDPPRVRK